MVRFISDLKATHPRLLATEQDFARIRDFISCNDVFKTWWADIKKQADELPATGVERGDPDVGYLWSARELKRRVMLLSLVYQISGDTAYAEKAYEQMMFVCQDGVNGFYDWDPEHFLDTSETMITIAYGYDWLYDFLTEEQRSNIKGALIERGLMPAKATYEWYFDQKEEPPYKLKPFIRNGWVNTNNNWGCVCNSSIAVAALCLADEEPELCEYCLQSALRSITPALAPFSPEGSYVEGRAYWGYATRYLFEMLGSLETALGTTFGLHEYPGLKNTWQYPFHLTGSSGYVFNFSDSGLERNSTVPEMFYFANKYGIVGLGNERYRALIGKEAIANSLFLQVKPSHDDCRLAVNNSKQKVTVKDLIWCKSLEYLECDTQPAIERDKHYKVDALVTMRSEIGNGNGLFVGIKAGDNAINHGDLDSGTFVLDALGERWVCDLGSDLYSLPGYFEDDPRGCRRWEYYRKRAEGHNTLVINPDMLPDQVEKSYTSFCDVQINTDEPYAVCDLTKAYERNGAEKVMRSVKLTNNRTVCVLQDKIVTAKASDIWWFVHTQAQVELSDDRRSAILSIGDKKISVQLEASSCGSFTVMDAKPLEGCPNPPGQDKNEGYRKLAIHLSHVSSASICVSFNTQQAKTEL